MKIKKYSFFDLLLGRHIKHIYVGLVPIERYNVFTGNSLGEIEMAVYKVADKESGEIIKVYATGDGEEIEFQVEPFLKENKLILK